MAPPEQAAQRPGLLVRAPGDRQKARVEQFAESLGVDLVGLHLGLGDRPHAPCVSNDYTPDVGREDARDCVRRSGRLERHLVVRRQAPRE
jgi:hypothetical protein